MVQEGCGAGTCVGPERLGAMYCYGIGVAQNYKEAVRWFTKAAEQGDAKAQCCVGVMYCEGQGVAQDYIEGVKWYTKATEQGHAGAQCNLGVMYCEGEGVAQDYSEGVKWYTKAAEQGHALAQYNNLGASYYEGRGVPEDYAEAYKWAIIAMSGTDAALRADATHLRDILRQEMTPSQIEEAQKRASDFVNQRKRNPTQEIQR